jgi:hypothetical protein
MPDLLTITEAADELGISRQAVAELVRVCEIRTKSVPYNGRARGLTPRHIEILRQTLDSCRELAATA